MMLFTNENGPVFLQYGVLWCITIGMHMIATEFPLSTVPRIRRDWNNILAVDANQHSIALYGSELGVIVVGAAHADACNYQPERPGW
jgi:hypothetical protein